MANKKAREEAVKRHARGAKTYPVPTKQAEAALAKVQAMTPEDAERNFKKQPWENDPTIIGQKSMDEALADAKEAALRELDRYATDTWTEYNCLTVLDTVITHGITVASHIEKRRQALRDAQGLAAIDAALTKGKRSVHHAALFLWAQGKTMGPSSPARLEKHARKAEALADHLDRIGKPENADKQRARAKSLRNGEVPQKVKKAPREPRPCICGCGKTTMGSFAPGHDSKVHSLVLNIARGKDASKVSTTIVEYVKKSEWLKTAELAAFLKSQT